MFETRIREAAEATDAALDRLLQPEARPGEIARPARLLEAMRYAVLGPGKRLRPFLVIETARLFGMTGEPVAETAAALECIHAYSLAHDDLPAMDDDDLRRGRPTAHIAYDEATAILVGDGLQALAFDILARIDAPAATRIALTGGLARAGGIGGMVGGQALDMDGDAAETRQAIATMQAMKTGALISFSVAAGAILANAPAGARARLATYGTRIGQAFQIADDLIDATGDTETAGKRTAKDQGQGKRTLIALQGVDAARASLAEAVDAALRALDHFGDEADTLRQAARFIAARKA